MIKLLVFAQTDGFTLEFWFLKAIYFADFDFPIFW